MKYLIDFYLLFNLNFSIHIYMVKHRRNAQSHKTKVMPRRAIPKAKRRAIWVQHIGEYIFRTTCTSCGSKEIDAFDFEAGHVRAHSKGGSDDIKNLVPICGICNKSMGDQNMKKFMKIHFKRILQKILGHKKILNRKLKKLHDDSD